MADKKKWTVIDTAIVIVAVVAVAGCYKMFGGKLVSGDTRTITAQILISNKEPAFYEAIAVGEEVTLSLTEKDSGIVKEVTANPAEIMTYSSNKGEYQMETDETKVDVYATVEMEVEENDYAFTVGSTSVKVGDPIPFRGKGYAAEGYVISINEEAE